MMENIKYRTVQEIIFDTIFMPENVSQPSRLATAFVIPVGSYAGRMIKGHEHTNMVQCGMLQAPWEMDVHSLSTAILDRGGYITDENRCWDGQIDLYVGMKSCIAGALRSFASRRLLHDIPKGFMPITAWKKADPEKFPAPLVRIRQQECFTCRVSFDHAVNSTMELVIGISGILYVEDMQNYSASE